MSFLFLGPVPSALASTLGLPGTSWVGGLGLPPTPMAGVGPASSVLCSVPRAGLEMPTAPQAQDSVGTGAGQTAGRLTPGRSQPGGAQEEGQ